MSQINDGSRHTPNTYAHFSHNDYDERAIEWVRMCMRGVAATNATTASWLHLTCVAIALHTSQIHSTPSARADNRIAVIENINESESKCKDLLRLSPTAFDILTRELKHKSKLKNYSRCTIAEQLVTFLLVLSHNMKNRVVRYFLCRSGETISRYFNNILAAIITLEASYVKQPNAEEVQPAIRNSQRFFPFFKNCLGAIDGTHVRVKVSQVDAPRYRGRKEWPTQNVLAACKFDLKFTYILAGWEGTVADSRILQNALTREEPLVIPDGKFYLGDAGFGLTSKVLTPYARTRYYLKECSKRGPETPEELFNHRHSSLRNAIERAFGVLKKRFPIIASGSECQYSCDKMTNIILACCVLHNFVLTIGGGEPISLMSGSANVVAGLACDEEENNTSIHSEGTEEYVRGKALRDCIAREMWTDYCNRREQSTG